MNLVDRLQSFVKTRPLNNERSLVTLCYAQSWDGSIAVKQGKALPVSGQESRILSHALRAVHDAVIVGIGMVLADDPGLTVRGVPGKNPQPVIFDSSLRFSLNSQMSNNDCKPWIFTNDRADVQKKQLLEKKGIRILRAKASADNMIDIPYVLRELKFMGMDRVLVEGGTTVIEHFIKEGFVDMYVLFITPVAVSRLLVVEQKGDRTGTLEGVGRNFPWLSIAGQEKIGNDLVVWGMSKLKSN